MSYDPHQQPPYVHGQQPYYPPPPDQPYGAPPPMFPVYPAPKKSNPWKAIGIAAAVVLAVCVGGSVIAAVAGSGPEPRTAVLADGAGQSAAEDDAPADKAADGNQGQFDLTLGTKVVVREGSTTQNVTVKSFKTHKAACNQFFPGPDNGMFIVVDVQVEAVKGSVPVNALNFTWVAEDGNTSNSLDGAFSGCDKNHLDAADVRAGQKRAGQIVFDVASAKGAVEFKAGLFAETAASWKVP
jgi:hypothetical protein